MTKIKSIAMIMVTAMCISIVSTAATAADTGYRKLLVVEVQEDADISVKIEDKGWWTADKDDVPEEELLGLLLTALAAEREVKLFYNTSGKFYKARVH